LSDAMSGLEKLLHADIPKGSVVMITGAEGTLKSGVAFSLASNYLERSRENGLYITLEQTGESHLQNMKSLGLKKSDTLHIFDCRDMRREWKDREPNLAKSMEEILDFYLDRYDNLAIMILDSLNVIYSLSDESCLRRDMYHLFSELRDRGLTSFLIMEDSFRGPGWSGYGGAENFLADGVIELGAIEGAEGVKRFVRIKKMRSAKHSMQKHQIIVEGDGLHILGPIY